MAKVTIKDVAREAGVSISTVSNALNDVDVLRPETKEHILQVADRLHYIPNLNGRNLKAGATKVIGVFTPYIGGPYLGTLADTMVNKCRADGYELQLFATTQRRRIMANLMGGRVDGAILLQSPLSAKHEKQLQDAEIPVLYLNKEICGKYQASVSFDSYQAGCMAAEYFWRKGITEAGIITGDDDYDSNERCRGFLDVLKEKNIIIKEECIWQGDFSKEEAYRVMKAYIDEKKTLPQAIFAANDLSAIGCMKALTEAGITVPDRVKILGCDDIELAQYVNPPLTTIRTNFEEQGAMAVDCLLDMLKGNVDGVMKKLSCHMIERESAL